MHQRPFQRAKLPLEKLLNRYGRPVKVSAKPPFVVIETEDRAVHIVCDLDAARVLRAASKIAEDFVIEHEDVVKKMFSEVRTDIEAKIREQTKNTVLSNYLSELTVSVLVSDKHPNLVVSVKGFATPNIFSGSYRKALEKILRELRSAVGAKRVYVSTNFSVPPVAKTLKLYVYELDNDDAEIFVDISLVEFHSIVVDTVRMLFGIGDHNGVSDLSILVPELREELEKLEKSITEIVAESLDKVLDRYVKVHF